MLRMRIRILAWSSLLFAAAMALGVATICIGMMNARSIPIVRHAIVHVQGLENSPHPISIALVSDIHLGNRSMDAERLALIVGQINAARPDVILLAGDFITGGNARGASEQVAGLTGPLKGLRARLCIAAVLGNHDYRAAPNAVGAALTDAGITVLDNQTVRCGPLTVIGIGDRFSGHDDVRKTLVSARSDAGVPVVLTHSPDLVPYLPADLPLVVAGHTHCGQIVLPWIGPLGTYAPSPHRRHLYNPRYRCGIVRDGSRTTIVTAGVGTSTWPIRLGAMPDWWLLSLQP